MDDPTPDEDGGAEIARLRVLWLALAAAVIVYGALGFFLADRTQIAIAVELRRWIEVFLGILAGIHVLVALLLKQMVAGVSAGRYFTYCLLRWTAIEAIGVYGLVLAILGASAALYGAFLLVSLATLASLSPSEDGRRAFLQLLD